MEPLTIVFIVLSAVLFGVIVWQTIAKWKQMTPETKNELFDKGLLLVNYLKAAWSNDGRIDMSEFSQILKYLIEIIAFLGDRSESAVRMQTGTETLLSEKE